MGRKQNSLRLATAVSNPTLSASSFVSGTCKPVIPLLIPMISEGDTDESRSQSHQKGSNAVWMAVLPHCVPREGPHQTGPSCRQRQAGLPQGRRVPLGVARGLEARAPFGL